MLIVKLGDEFNEHMVIAMQKGSLFKDKINQALKHLEETGAIAQLKKKWLSEQSQ